MKNRTVSRDLGLAFVKEHHELYHPDDALGMPLQMKNMDAGSSRGCATWRAPPHHDARAASHVSDVAAARGREREGGERLGHSKVSITMDVYSHVLPSMGRGAADRLGALLHGRFLLTWC